MAYAQRIVLLQPFLDTQLQTQLLDLTSSAKRAMAGNAEASVITLFDALLKAWEIRDNFKTLTPFYVECVRLCFIDLIKQN